MRLVRVYLTKMIILLQAIRQVLRIEVVTLLIWFINRTIALVLWMRQFDYIFLINVRAILCILSFVIWWIFKKVIDNWEGLVAAAIHRPICVIAYILIYQRLPRAAFDQFLKFLLSSNEVISDFLHHWVFHSGSGQILNMLFWMVHMIDNHLLIVWVRSRALIVLVLYIFTLFQQSLIRSWRGIFI